MAKKRLNDTEALSGRPLEGSLERTVSTRKIDNGYLTRTSTYNSMTGAQSCRESFSRKPVDIEKGPRSTVGNEGPDSLKDTMGYLNNDR